MAKRSDGARLMVVGPRELLALQVGQRMASTIGAAVRRLGYAVPTASQWRAVSQAITREALSMAGRLTPEETDDEIDLMADTAAHAILRETLGPPPGAN